MEAINSRVYGGSSLDPLVKEKVRVKDNRRVDVPGSLREVESEIELANRKFSVERVGVDPFEVEPKGSTFCSTTSTSKSGERLVSRA